MPPAQNTPLCTSLVINEDGSEDPPIYEAENITYDSKLQQIFVICRPGWWNYAKQYFTLQEISGSLGDLGTFLPLVTAMAVNQVNGQSQIAFGPVLFFAGVYTVMISTYYDIPIPVQPMKTIASVSLLQNTTREEIIAAGILMACCMFFLGVTGLIKVIQRITPVPLIRGVQLGLGLGLMKKGVALAYVKKMMFDPVTHNIRLLKETQWLGLDSVLVSILFGGLCIWFNSSKKIPSALVLFLYGIGVALYRYFDLQDDFNIGKLTFGPNFEAPIVPTGSDFWRAFVMMVLPQLPLTILNSVIALEKLSEDLFKDKIAPIKRTSLSIAIGNFSFSWFGMLAMCHGAGGLASQYAFGARSNVSIFFLGVMKILLALLFGTSSIVLLQKGIFPDSVLGVMLTFSGLNLALVATDIHDRDDAIIMLMTAGITLARNTGIGFLAGLCTALILHFSKAQRAE